MKIEFLENLRRQLRKERKSISNEFYEPTEFRETRLEILRQNRIKPSFWKAYNESRNLELLNFGFEPYDALMFGTVRNMRQFCIKDFTVSIQGNNAIKSIKKFVDSGCEITGVTTIKLFKKYPAIKLRVLDLEKGGQLTWC